MISNLMKELHYWNDIIALDSTFQACWHDGLVQDWSNSIANTLELLLSCTKA